MTSLLPRGQPTCLAEGDGRGEGGSHWVDRQQGDPVGRWVRVGLGGGGLQTGRSLSVCVGGGEVRGGGWGMQAFKTYDTKLNFDQANTVLYFSTRARN